MLTAYPNSLICSSVSPVSATICPTGIPADSMALATSALPSALPSAKPSFLPFISAEYIMFSWSHSVIISVSYFALFSFGKAAISPACHRSSSRRSSVLSGAEPAFCMFFSDQHSCSNASPQSSNRRRPNLYNSTNVIKIVSSSTCPDDNSLRVYDERYLPSQPGSSLRRPMSVLSRPTRKTGSTS